MVILCIFSIAELEDMEVEIQMKGGDKNEKMVCAVTHDGIGFMCWDELWDERYSQGLRQELESERLCSGLWKWR